MLKLSDLSLRPDFQLGPMLVSPPRRLVQGPGGSASVQPLIMQVFLMLVDARGQVVTRNDLFDQVWGGVMVGDDSLNRAIGKVRQIGAQVAPGLFEIETIPRTGYRLTGEILTSEHRLLPDSERRSQFGISRRAMLGAATAVGLVAAGGLGLWSARRSGRTHVQRADGPGQTSGALRRWLQQGRRVFPTGCRNAARQSEGARSIRADASHARGRWWARSRRGRPKGRPRGARSPCNRS